jgi:hypothetical protein
MEYYSWRRLVLEYRLPTWGITLLGAVGLVSAGMGFFVSLFSFYTPALPSEYVVPIPLIQVVIVGYSFVAVFVTFLVSVGLLAHLNIARIAAMILAPAPFVGSVLMVVHQSLVNQAIGTPNGIQQLVPLGRLATALTYTGISFPGTAPLLLALLLHMSIFGSPIIILFGLLNLGIPFYLANRHVKNAFRKIRGQKQAPLS